MLCILFNKWYCVWQSAWSSVAVHIDCNSDYYIFELHISSVMVSRRKHGTICFYSSCVFAVKSAIGLYSTGG